MQRRYLDLLQHFYLEGLKTFTVIMTTNYSAYLRCGTLLQGLNAFLNDLSASGLAPGAVPTQPVAASSPPTRRITFDIFADEPAKLLAKPIIGIPLY